MSPQTVAGSARLVARHGSWPAHRGWRHSLCVSLDYTLTEQSNYPGLLFN